MKHNKQTDFFSCRLVLLTVLSFVLLLSIPHAVHAQEDSVFVSYEDYSSSWNRSIKRSLDNLLQGNLFQTSQVGIMVWDLDADSAIYRYNERQLMRPASTMKVITAVTALDQLGGSYEYRTNLSYKGVVENGVLLGDVYCVGGFDPLFGAEDMAAFVGSLRALGVDTIRGNIYADKSMKEGTTLGEGWCWDDDNPVLSPLLFEGKDMFMEQFLNQLQSAGIYVDAFLGNAREPVDAQRICTRRRSLDQVLLIMMKESDNLLAESVFYHIAASSGNRPATTKDGRSVVKRLINRLGLDPANYKIADGSGLSLYNYVTPELEVAMLRYASRKDEINVHLRPTLPVASVDGTLKQRMGGGSTRGNVCAKTGTVTGISSLAGYCTAGNGHRMCFSIINQGIITTKVGRDFQDKVCTILCETK